MYPTCVVYDIEASKQNFCSVTEIRKNGYFARYQSKSEKGWNHFGSAVHISLGNYFSLTVSSV